jgi:uncharacterized SAM-binding protein YcdF (DUF218 family)
MKFELPRQEWKLRPSLVALGIGVLIVGIIFYREIRFVESIPLNAWTDDQSADCAVVLTGGPGRVREGMDLMAQKRVKKLVISGANPTSSFRDIVPGWVFYGTIDFADVVIEKRSTTTYGNAQQVISLVEALKCRDVVLITSRLHMYRALRTFRGVFPPELPILPRAVVGSSIRARWGELIVEASKSLFYSLWAYD